MLNDIASIHYHHCKNAHEIYANWDHVWIELEANAENHEKAVTDKDKGNILIFK